ncbi:MAG: large conductance mechanosensitive channel protein MscL [Clostridia bacterium]|nr:large conductance mechanosensitive channel protein MscL [Clostridia bacterium]
MAKNKKSGFFTDFKKFITKGNILDMAVGMIIGTAFNQIVKSLVDHILMPVIGNLCNTQDLVDLKYVLTPEVLDEAGAVVTPEVAISYGLFLSYVINFFIVALTLFVIIRSAMRFQQKMESLRQDEEEAAPPPPPAPAEPTVEEKTLAVLNEIKTLLDEKK